MYGRGYSEVMDYGAIDAFPNPGYGTAAGMQDPNDDVLVQKMADVLQNQFGLKPKMQGPAYTPPLPEWYHRVILPPTSYRVHEVLWARRYKHCRTHCPILDAAWGSFS
jgi:hypothetical protein